VKTISVTYHLDEPPEQVANVLVSAAFNVAAERLREETVSSKQTLLEQNDERTRYELHTVERQRSMTGSLKRSTFTSTNVSTYDVKTRTMRWTYRGQLGDRARFSGVYHLYNEGQGTRLVHAITVDVRIPIIRRALTGAVCRALERAWPDFERLLKVFLKRVKTGSASSSSS
jgi:Protein of unknown function (DUF2505)